MKEHPGDSAGWLVGRDSLDCFTSHVGEHKKVPNRKKKEFFKSAWKWGYNS